MGLPHVGESSIKARTPCQPLKEDRVMWRGETAPCGSLSSMEIRSQVTNERALRSRIQNLSHGEDKI